MWEEVYTSACADIGVAPRAEILSAGSTSSVHLRGNTFERFHNRVSDGDVSALAALCARLPHLSELHLSYNHITSAGASALARAMREGFDSLQFLDLSHNSITADGAADVAEAAAAHDGIGALLLCGNPIGSAWAPAARRMLSGRAPLVTLDLEGTDQDMHALVEIARGLSANATLAALNLGRPLLSNPDDVAYVVRHIALALRENRTLFSLGLSHFNMADDDAALLLPAVAGSAVADLSLRGNRLSQGSGETIAKLLASRADFASLDVSANRLRDVGAAAIAAEVAVHSGLRVLHMESNTIGGAGITAIAKAIEANESLTSVHLWGNDFSDESLEELYANREKIEAMTNVDFSFYVVDGQPMIARE